MENAFIAAVLEKLVATRSMIICNVFKERVVL